MTVSQVHLYDTTLRDGTQGEGISFSTMDKVRIARALDDAGFSYIEGGYPASNPRDEGFFAELAKEPLKRARLSAFGMTMKKDSDSPEVDSLLQPLIRCETPAITIVGKSWDLQVRLALETELDRNLALIEQSVGYVKKHTDELIYDAEHFFDGWKENRAYAQQTLTAAISGGSDWLVLCDTNGGTMPWEVEEITAEVVAWMKTEGTSIPLGIHCHNDTGNGIACSLAAVRSGATKAQGTVGGIGERTGNADLLATAANLTLKMGIPTLPDNNIAQISDLSKFVFEMLNRPVPNALPYVGRSAFAHKGGMHASAIARDSKTYEHINPDKVGNKRRILVSDLAGRSNIVHKLKQIGYDNLSNDHVSEVLVQLKELENTGYEFEGADASLQLLVDDVIGRDDAPFVVRGFRITDVHFGSEANFSEASIEIEVNGDIEHTAAFGNGPVNALDNAFRKALINFFPSLDRVELLDYKVRVLAGSEGTESNVRVLITSWDGRENWQTVGVSSDVIDASYRALAASYLWYLRHAPEQKERV